MDAISAIKLDWRLSWPTMTELSSWLTSVLQQKLLFFPQSKADPFLGNG
jgi:hypothetical protein